MKECKVEGCESKLLAKELCNKHYLEMRHHGKVFTSDQERKNHLMASGHISGMPRLTQPQVKQIKTKIDEGFKIADIAKEFDVTPGCISNIKSGQRRRYS